jgi:hypothetical protein
MEETMICFNPTRRHDFVLLVRLMATRRAPLRGRP